MNNDYRADTGRTLYTCRPNPRLSNEEILLRTRRDRRMGKRGWK